MVTSRYVPRAAGFVRLVALAGLLALAAPSPARAEEESPAGGNAGAEAAPVSDAQLAEARLLFQNGVELIQATPPNYQDAFPQFLLAYEKSGHSWKVLGNLGLSALKLERDGDALAYYRTYLDQGGDEVDPSERSSIERELLLIRGNMATITLTTAEPGARLSVKREGSSAPAQLYQLSEAQTEMGVRAGQLELVVSSGEKQETWQVVLAAGEAKSHSFTFAPPPTVAAPTGAPVPAAPAAPSRAASPLSTVGWVTVGVGAAALIGGGVTGFLAKDQERAALSECISGICQVSTEAKFRSAADVAMLANVLFIAGGVLAATGVTLVIVGSRASPSDSAAALSLAPMAGPSFGGLTAFGHF